MRIDLITLFPEMAEGFLSSSILGKARKKGLVDIAIHHLRSFAEDKHSTVDDRPFGGGAGMVLKPEPLFLAVETLKSEETKVLYLCPDGQALQTPMAQELAKLPHLILLSGHYEGIDQRVRDCLVDQEISIGDYVLTNGTLPACVLIDCVTRYLPQVLGEEKSLTQDSFTNRLLACPQYTRPARFRNMEVPKVLLQGNEAKIKNWKQQQQFQKTLQRRKDILPHAP